MGFVDQQIGAGFPFNGRYFLKRRGVAQHRIDPLHDDQAMAGRAFQSA